MSIVTCNSAGLYWHVLDWSFITDAVAGRQHRIYYYNDRWPWMLLVVQGGKSIAEIDGLPVVVLCNGFEGTARPRWVMQGRSPARSRFTKGPAHWAAGYYKVTILPSMREDDQPPAGLLTEDLDEIQVSAMGPMVSVLMSSYRPVFQSGSANEDALKFLHDTLLRYVNTVARWYPRKRSINTDVTIDRGE